MGSASIRKVSRNRVQSAARGSAPLAPGSEALRLYFSTLVWSAIVSSREENRRSSSLPKIPLARSVHAPPERSIGKRPMLNRSRTASNIDPGSCGSWQKLCGFAPTFWMSAFKWRRSRPTCACARPARASRRSVCFFEVPSGSGSSGRVLGVRLPVRGRYSDAFGERRRGFTNGKIVTSTATNMPNLIAEKISFSVVASGAVDL